MLLSCCCSLRFIFEVFQCISPFADVLCFVFSHTGAPQTHEAGGSGSQPGASCSGVGIPWCLPCIPLSTCVVDLLPGLSLNLAISNRQTSRRGLAAILESFITLDRLHCTYEYLAFTLVWRDSHFWIFVLDFGWAPFHDYMWFVDPAAWCFHATNFMFIVHIDFGWSWFMIWLDILCYARTSI